MKRWIIFIFLAGSAFPFSTVSAVGGTCIRKTGICPSGYDYSTTVHLTEYGTGTCDPGKGKVTVSGNGDYDVCCRTPDEVNSRFSVQAPLCGSSDELGKANSSCWTCGDTVRCAGADPNLAFGHTDNALTNPDNRKPVDNGDTSNLWLISNTLLKNGFEFNGQHYDAPSGDVIVCNANDAGCGASDTGCTNIRHPEYTTDEKGNPYFNGEPIKPGSATKEQIIFADPATNPGEPLTGNIALGIVGRIAPSKAADIFARIRYASNTLRERIFEMFPARLVRFGPIFERTAFTDLLPAQFNGQYNALDAGDKPGRYPLKGMSGYRLCIPNSDIRQPEGPPKDNLALNGLTATRENIGTKTNPRFWAQYLAGSNYLNSIFLNHLTKSLNYISPNGNLVDFDTIEEKDSDGNVEFFYKEKNWKELDSALYQCGAGTEGPSQPRVTRRASGEARTGSGPNAGSGSFLEDIKATIYRAAFRMYRCKEEDQEDECANAGQTLEQTDSIAAGNAGVIQTIGLDKNQLEKMPAYKQTSLIESSGAVKELAKPGGIVRAFLSSAIAKKIDPKTYQHAQTIQRQGFSFEKSGLKEGVERRAFPRWMKSAADGVDCMELAYTPKAVQKSGARCVYSQGEGEPYPGTADRGIGQWTTQSTIPPSFQITDTNVKAAVEEATKDQIPACVLEGVKFIESGTDWTSSQFCSVNNCSAAGPFQITTGWAPDPSAPSGWDNHCRMCGGNNPDSSWIDGKRDCPDGWEGNWPMTPTDPSPCEAGPAAKQAVVMLQAKAQYWTQKVSGTAQTLNSKDSIQSQRDAIMLAADSYWGKTATIERLGGCTYGEYVYKHCDSSYECTGNPPVSIPKP